MSNFPYPGLRPFQSDEIDIFFGREQHVDQLITRLGQTHFLAVVGLSGSGKSSLVNTGLLADLKTGFLASAGVRWQIAQMRPGNRPFVRLSKALLETSFNDCYLPELTNRDQAELFLQAQLQRGSLALDKLWQSKDTNLLVFVDQFEEIFRYYDQGYSEEAEAFISLLLASSKADKIYVVITMRSEFLGNCALFHNLPEAINQSQFLTPRLSRDQLYEAIVTPARVFGGDIDPVLVNQLLNDAGNDFDQLPLLQHALMRMWRLSDKKYLTLDDYEHIGGFNHALSKHADEAYAELTVEQQHIAEILFKNLSERSNENRDTRRLVAVDEVAKLAEVSSEEVMDVVEVFRKDGRSFLMPPVDNILDISHESLIRQWQRLKKWTEEEADAAKMYLRLQEKAEFWEKKEEALLHSPNLEMAIAWRDNSDRKPTDQWAARYGKHFDLVMRFLEASEQEQLKKARQKATYIGIGFLVSLAFAILAGWFGLQAHKNKEYVQVNQSLLFSYWSRQETDKGNTTNGILYGLEALPKNMSAPDKPYLIQAEENLYRAVIKQREILLMDAHTDAVNHIEFSPNGQYLLTASNDKSALLWDIKTGKKIHTFNRHNKAVSYAGFSPDGSKIITTSMDNSAALWDIKSGKRLQKLKGHHKKGILHATFSPDGNYVVTAGGGGNVRIWSVSDGKLVRVLKGHNKAVFHIAFNANTILTASLDKTVRLWDFKTGKLLNTLIGHEYGVYYAVFSPNGHNIVTTSMDNTARLWKSDGTLLHILKGHTKGIFHAAFSSSGLDVVTSSMDNTIRLWSVETGRLKKVFTGHTDWVSQTIFNLDDSKLISVSKDKTVRIWDAETGNRLSILSRHKKMISQVVLSPDGKSIATASMDNTASLWNIQNNETYFKSLIGHKKGIRRAIFSPNGKLALTSSWDKTARLWDVKTGKTLKVLAGHTERVYQSAFSSDGKLIVTGSFDNTARLWNVETGNLLHVLKGHENTVYNVNFSPDKLRVLTASWDHTARLWDVQTGKLIKVLSGHKDKVRKAKFSPNGKYIITVSNRVAKLWNADTGIFIKDFIGHDKVITNVAFNSDSSMIVTSSKDHTARVWNVETAELLKILSGHKKTVYNAVFSPDGIKIATSSWDDTARLWEVETGETIHILSEHKSDVYHVSFSSDGTKVVTASQDKTARIWDVATGKMLYLLDEHKDVVTYAEFSPDGKSIITASKDHTTHIWHLFPNTQELINYANQIVPRHLTNKQRKNFFLDYKKVITKKEVKLTPPRETSSGTNTNKPHFCNQIEEKAEAFICDNPLLWEIENQSYKLYHGLTKGFTQQEKDKFKHQYLMPWLHNIRNPQCEQSVPLCLQVYEQRIKELKSKFQEHN